ncbi:MAG: hypothetical protein H6R16_433 [Proteobacteria bacterium]|nr:hypothetical protein [Pseudomonadota bacterium]
MKKPLTLADQRLLAFVVVMGRKEITTKLGHLNSPSY